MKLLQGIALATGLSLSLAAFAQGDLIYSRSLASRPNIQEYGMGQDYLMITQGGKQIDRLHTYPDFDVVTALPNTFVPVLKPKGSDTPHGTGFVEQIWPDNNWYDGSPNALFSTESNGMSYLYSVYRVGNNAPNYDNRQATLNLGILHHRSVLNAGINGAKVMFAGDYNTSSSAPVALWKSVDNGLNWSKVIEWNTVGHQTRHIRGVVQNPYNGWIYILFGFQDADSGIVAWDGQSAPPPNNTPLNQMGNYPGWKSIAGSARVRTGDLVFTPKKCIWIPDAFGALSAGQKLLGQRANLDLTGLEATGEVPYTPGIPPIIGARSSSGNIYWASYRDASALEKKIHIWRSIDDGLSWTLASKIDVYTDWTAIPLDLTVRNLGGMDEVAIHGRDLELDKTGTKTGSVAYLRNQLDPVTQLAFVNSDAVSTVKNQPIVINILANDLNINGVDVISGAIINTVGVDRARGALHGTVRGATWRRTDLDLYNTPATAFIYTPDPGFVGNDTFTYVYDGYGSSNTATVNVEVTGTGTPPASSPVAIADTGTTTKGQAIILNLTNNDTNVGSSTVNIVGYPNSGSVLYADNTNKSIIYTPNTGFSGVDSFTYNLKSASGLSNTVAVTITVTSTTPPPPASAVATADAVSTSKGQAVTFNPTSNDTNIGTSTVNIVGYPGNGNVAYSDNTSKSITYTPNATFTGTDTFTYNLKSSAGTSNTVTVTITVGGTTPPPGGAVANGDTMTTTKGKPVTLNLTSNDTNVGASTVNIAGYPNNGNVAYSDSTKKSITYTPDATFVGSDSFTYNLKNASGTSNTATVSVTVQ